MDKSIKDLIAKEDGIKKREIKDNDIIKAILLDSLYYNVSTNVSSRHLKMHTQFRLIVKNELVAK